MSTPYQKKIQRRVSLAPSHHSSLSTKTKAILKRLQGSPIKTTGGPIKTPGMISSRPKKNSNMKTRLQMLASRARTQPYWTDLLRPKEVKENAHESTVPKEVEDILMVSTVIEDRSLRKPSRNFFSAKELEEEEDDAVVPVAAPPGVFTFDPPRCFTYSLKKTELPVTNPEPLTMDSSSSTDHTSSFESHEVSSSNETSSSSLAKHEETAQTPTDHPAAIESNPDDVSAPSEWTCQTCFVQNKDNLCVCCGTAKDGASAPTTVTSTFTPTIFTSTVSEVSAKYTFGMSAKAPGHSVTPETAKASPVAPSTSSVSETAQPSNCGNSVQSNQSVLDNKPNEAAPVQPSIFDNSQSKQSFSDDKPKEERNQKITFNAAPSSSESNLLAAFPAPTGVSVFSRPTTTFAAATVPGSQPFPFNSNSLASATSSLPASSALTIKPNDVSAPEWTCQTCFLQSKDNVCVCCGAAKDGTSTVAPTTVTSTFTPTIFTSTVPEVSTKYTFGMSAKAPKPSISDSATTSTGGPSGLTNNFGGISTAQPSIFGNSSKRSLLHDKPVEAPVAQLSVFGNMQSKRPLIDDKPNVEATAQSSIFDIPPSKRLLLGDKSVNAPNQNPFITFPANASFSAPNPAPAFPAPAAVPIFSNSTMTNFNFGSTAAPSSQPFVFSSNSAQSDASTMQRSITTGANRKIALARRRKR